MQKTLFKIKQSAKYHTLNLLKPNFTIGNIELTNRCPFKCIMCVRTYGMKRDQGDMPKELFKKIIDDYFETSPENAINKELSFTHFGESLLHNDFAPLIRYSVEKGAKDTLLSINPLMLTNDVSQKLIESRVQKIHISLDGHNDKTFEEIRGIPKAYERSKERLIKFFELLKDNSEYNPHIRFGMINFDHNSDSIKEVEEYWRNHPSITEMWIKPVVAWSGSEEEVNKHAKFKVDGSKERIPTCTLPWRNLTVLYDGRVVACCSDHDGKYVLGDLNDQTLTEVWNGEPIQKLRKEFMSLKVDNKLCKYCYFLNTKDSN